MKKANTISWVVRNDTDSNTVELERHYQAFMSNNKPLRAEDTDMDIFSFETATHLSKFFENRGMKITVRITEQVLSMRWCSKDGILQVLSAMAYTCLGYADKTKEIHFEVERNADRLSFSITYVAGILCLADSEQEVLDMLRNRIEQKGYEFRFVFENGLHTISLLI